ncbi:leucine-rich repeat-containing protein 74A-like isoform X3 [Lineus longissimus]|uniref:leucine-rich repeat-containing protein 74A-like isoform X3 n=1 Tax=Lineus longissimus TaxID=88925 RepID=UPI00315D4C88
MEQEGVPYLAYDEAQYNVVEDRDLIDYDDDGAADDEDDMDPIREEEEADNGDRTTRSASAKMPLLSRAKFTRTPGSRASDNSDVLPHDIEPPETQVPQEENGLTNEDDERLSETTDSVLITEVKDQAEQGSVGSEDGRDTVDGELEDVFIGDEDVIPEKEEVAEGSDEDCDTDLEVEEEEIDKEELHDTTGRTRYTKLCEKLGVVPCSYFTRHIQDSELIMKFHGLGPQGTRAIAKILKDNITIERLNLEGNWMEADGAKAMAKMLEENISISDLVLRGNKLGSDGGYHMSKMLENNTTLKRIDLSGNDFEDRDAEYFADALEENKCLHELILSNNKFGEEAGELLGFAVGSNDILEHLDLSWNQIRGAGAVAVGKGLKMGSNPVTTAGAIAIVAALNKNENSVLVFLDLTDIPVEFEFIRTVEDIQRKRSFRVIHGLVLRSGNTPDDIGKPPIDPNLRHPLLIMKEHVLVNDMRIVEVFRRYDTNNTMCVTPEQFMDAMDELKLKYWRSQIDDIAKKLDKFGNGTIYYGDFIPPDPPRRESAILDLKTASATATA